MTNKPVKSHDVVYFTDFKSTEIVPDWSDIWFKCIIISLFWKLTFFSTHLFRFPFNFLSCFRLKRKSLFLCLSRTKRAKHVQFFSWEINADEICVKPRRTGSTSVTLKFLRTAVQGVRASVRFSLVELQCSLPSFINCSVSQNVKSMQRIYWLASPADCVTSDTVIHQIWLRCSFVTRTSV